MSDGSRMSLTAVAGLPVDRGAAVHISGALRGVLAMVGCVALVTVGAKMSLPVPGTDVPFTLQAAAVLLTGYWLSPPRALSAMLMYLGLGAAGWPVFSPASLGLLGPTGGYLVGFALAAWLVAMLKGGRDAGGWRLLGAGLAGMAAILLTGVAWRVVLFGGNIGLAVATGLLPFLVKTTIQVGLAATLVAAWRRARSGGPEVMQ